MVMPSFSSKISVFIVVCTLILTISTPLLAGVEGVQLIYKGLKRVDNVSTTWTSNVTIVSYNSSFLEAVSIVENRRAKVFVKYNKGIPIATSYLTSVIYLPMEARNEILRGNLSWIYRINIENPSPKIINITSSLEEVELEAGVLKALILAINLTTGILKIGYDVDSGFMIFEEYISVKPVKGYVKIELKEMYKGEQKIFPIQTPTKTPYSPTYTPSLSPSPTPTEHEKKHETFYLIAYAIAITTIALIIIVILYYRKHKVSSSS